MRSYKTITYEDRKNIEKMYKSGMSMLKIAEAIGKDYSTVYRELQRCPKGQYTADEAQRDGESKRKPAVKYNPSGKHLTYENRVELEQMIKAGKTIPEMAVHFEKCVRSIQREMERCSGEYTADEAQRDVERAKERKKAANKVNSQIRKKKKENEYKSRICACLRINPQANIEDVRKATGIPIEKLTKYYDKLQREVVNK